MNVNRVLTSHVDSHLPDGFQERQALDVPDRSADLHHHHVDLAPHPLDGGLDLVGDVGDDLDRLSQVLSLALLPDDGLVDLSRRGIVVAAHLGAGEPLVVTQIQIRLGAVVGHEHLAVLERTHGSRIDVDVRVQFKERHLQTTSFQEAPDGSRRQTFAQRTQHSARHENELGRHPSSPLPPLRLCVSDLELKSHFQRIV